MFSNLKKKVQEATVQAKQMGQEYFEQKNKSRDGSMRGSVSDLRNISLDGFESDTSMTSNNDSVTASPQSLSAEERLATLEARFRHYKSRYAELYGVHQETLKERDKLRQTIPETQDKLLRRIDELQEQVKLDQMAKKDIELNYTNLIEERNEHIKVLQQQIKIFRENQLGASPETIQMSPSNDCDQALRDKVKRLEGLLNACRDNIRSNKEKLVSLKLENDQLKAELLAKDTVRAQQVTTVGALSSTPAANKSFSTDGSENLCDFGGQPSTHESEPLLQQMMTDMNNFRTEILAVLGQLPESAAQDGGITPAHVTASSEHLSNSELVQLLGRRVRKLRSQNECTSQPAATIATEQNLSLTDSAQSVTSNSDDVLQQYVQFTSQILRQLADVVNCATEPVSGDATDVLSQHTQCGNRLLTHLETMKSQTLKASVEAAQLRSEFKLLHEQLSAETQAFDEANSLKTQLNELTHQAVELRQIKADLTSQLDKRSDLLEQVEKRCRQLTDQTASLQRQLDDEVAKGLSDIVYQRDATKKQLDGQQSALETKLHLTVQSETEARAQSDSLRLEIDRLSAALNSHSDSLKAAEHSTADLQNILSAQGQQLTDAERLLREQQQLSATKQQQINDLERSISHLQTQLTEKESALVAIGAQMADAATQNTQVESSCTQLSQQITELQTKLNFEVGEKERLQTLLTDRETLVDENKRLSLQLCERYEEIKTLMQTSKAQTDQLESFEQDLHRHRSQQEDSQQLVNSLQASCEEQQAQCAFLNTELSNAKTALAASEARLQAMAQLEEQLRKADSELLSHRGVASVQLHEAQQRVEELQQGSAQHSQQIMELHDRLTESCADKDRWQQEHAHVNEALQTALQQHNAAEKALLQREADCQQLREQIHQKELQLQTATDELVTANNQREADSQQLQEQIQQLRRQLCAAADEFASAKAQQEANSQQLIVRIQQLELERNAAIDEVVATKTLRDADSQRMREQIQMLEFQLSAVANEATDSRTQQEVDTQLLRNQILQMELQLKASADEVSTAKTRRETESQQLEEQIQQLRLQLNAAINDVATTTAQQNTNSQQAQEQVRQLELQLDAAKNEVAAMKAQRETDSQQFQEQIQQLQLQLTSATEEVATVTFQREADSQQLLEKIHQLQLQLGAATDEVVLTKTQSETDSKQFQEQVQQLKLQLDDAKNETATTKAQREADSQQLLHRVHQLELQLNAMTNETTSFRTQREADSQLLQERIQQLEHLLAASADEVATAKTQRESDCQGLRKQIEQLELQLSVAADEVASTKVSLLSMNSAADEKLQHIASLQNQLATTQSELKDAITNVASLEHESASKTRIVQELQNKLSDHSQALLDSERRNSELQEASLQQAMELEELRSHIDQLTERTVDLNAQLDLSKAEKETQISAATELQARLTDTACLASTRQQESANLAALLEETSSKLASSNQQLSNAQEHCLSLQQQINELNTVNKRLSSEKDGLIRQHTIDTQMQQEEAQGRLDELKKKAEFKLSKIKKSLETERDEERLLLQNKVSNLEDQLTSERNEHLLAVEQLRANIERKDTRLEQMQTTCDQLTARVDELSQEAERLQHQLLNSDLQCGDNSYLYERISSLERQSVDYQHQIRQLKEQLEEQQRERELDAYSTEEQHKQQLATMKREYDDKVKALELDFNGRCKQILKEAHYKVVEQERQLKQEYESVVENRKDSEAKEYVQLKHQVKELQRQMYQRDKRIEELVEEYENKLQAEFTQIDQLRSQLRQETTIKDAILASLKSLCDDDEEAEGLTSTENVAETADELIRRREENYLLQIADLEARLDHLCSSKLVGGGAHVAQSTSSGATSMAELVELEYVKNILYDYMSGKETKQLAKVIATVLKFPAEQLERIMNYEQLKERSSWFSLGQS